MKINYVSISFFLLLLIVLTWGTAFANSPSYNGEILNLDDCIQLGLEYNLDLIRTENTSIIYKAGIGKAYSTFYPQLNFGARRNRNWSPQGTYDPLTGTFESTGERDISDAYSMSLSLSQTIFNKGTEWMNLSNAKSDYNASKLDLESAKQSLIYNIEGKYYALLKAQQTLDVNQEALELTQQQLERAETMFSLGSVAQIDVLQVQVNTSQAELIVLTSKNNVDLARASLCDILGLESTIPIKITETDIIELDEKILPTLEEYFEEALENRSDLEAMNFREKKASTNVCLAKSGYLPSISLSGSYAWSNDEMKFDHWNDNTTWSLGISLNMTIFNGFYTHHNIKQAKYNLYNQTTSRSNLERQIKLEVKTAYLNLLTSKERITTSEKLVYQSEENHRKTMERYNLGSGTMLEVVDAQVSLQKAKNQYIEAYYDYLLAESQLDKAIGK